MGSRVAFFYVAIAMGVIFSLSLIMPDQRLASFITVSAVSLLLLWLTGTRAVWSEDLSECPWVKCVNVHSLKEGAYRAAMFSGLCAILVHFFTIVNPELRSGGFVYPVGTALAVSSAFLSAYFVAEK